MNNIYTLLAQLKESEKMDVCTFISKRFKINKIEHKTLAGLLQQQDKEIRQINKVHRREIMDHYDKDLYEM